MLHCFSIIITIIDFINPPFSLFPNTPAHSPTLSSLIFLFTRANQTFSHVEHLRTSAFLFFFFPFSFFYIYICIYISLHSLLHTHAFGCSLIVSYYYFFFSELYRVSRKPSSTTRCDRRKKKRKVTRVPWRQFDIRLADIRSERIQRIDYNEKRTFSYLSPGIIEQLPSWPPRVYVSLGLFFCLLSYCLCSM